MDEAWRVRRVPDVRADRALSRAAAPPTPPPLPAAPRRSPPEAVIVFSAALPMRRVAALEKRVLAAADPSSPQYGQWLSRAEVAALVTPK